MPHHNHAERERDISRLSLHPVLITQGLFICWMLLSQCSQTCPAVSVAAEWQETRQILLFVHGVGMLAIELSRKYGKGWLKHQRLGNSSWHAPHIHTHTHTHTHTHCQQRAGELGWRMTLPLLDQWQWNHTRTRQRQHTFVGIIRTKSKTKALGILCSIMEAVAEGIGYIMQCNGGCGWRHWVHYAV